MARYRRFRRSARAYGFRARRYGRRSRGVGMNYWIGAGLGYLKPISVHPLQDAIITALAVSPVKILPGNIHQVARGYALGMCGRAVFPNAFGAFSYSGASDNGGGGDFV